MKGPNPDARPIQNVNSAKEAIEQGTTKAHKIQSNNLVYTGFIVVTELYEDVFGEPSALDDEK